MGTVTFNPVFVLFHLPATTVPPVVTTVPAVKAVGTVWSIVIVVLLPVPVAAFPAASVNIAVRVTTPASANPFKASSWAAVMDTVLVVFIADMVAGEPRLA